MPTLTPEGLEPRHVDLRPFAINDGDDVWVLPGGLTRVALAARPAHRQLVARRRLEGHVGARRRAPSRPGRDPRVPRRVRRVRRRAAVRSPRGLRSRPTADAAATAGVAGVMLSRIAESLFWIGRYVERADNTARLLDVHLNVLLEDPWVDEPTANASLLAVMHVEVEGDGDSRGGARAPSRRTQAVASRSRARWAPLATMRGAPARSSRPRCGSRSTRRTCSSARARARRVRTTSSRGCASAPRSCGGCRSATTSRDDAWHFMELGRSLERADMIARLLMTRSLEGTTGPNWTTLLRSCRPTRPTCAPSARS